MIKQPSPFVSVVRHNRQIIVPQPPSGYLAKSHLKWNDLAELELYLAKYLFGRYDLADFASRRLKSFPSWRSQHGQVRGPRRRVRRVESGQEFRGAGVDRHLRAAARRQDISDSRVLRGPVAAGIHGS